MDVYIYYLAQVQQADAIQQQVTHMQAQLTHSGTVKAQLKRRPTAKDGYHTWMEVYLNTDQDFETQLRAAVNTAGLDALIEGPRHTEYFVDYTPCA